MSEHQPFVHLHVHSEYSLLDGLSRIDDLVARAKSLNQPALALTDHGAMYGVIPFYRACKAGGIKPIIGIESYVASRTMRDRDSNLDKDRFHLLLLAQNQTGYQNLLKIASAAQLEGYYYRPRVDHDFLAAHADGLIATTGCLAAEIPRAIDRGQIDKAHQLMRYYLDVFGPDRFFIELQEHDIPQLVTVNNTLMEFAKQYNLRFLATNDVHYTSPEEAVPHDVLLCIQTSATVQQQNRMRLSNKEYYLKSHAEMAKLFGHIPGALENSLLIAEQCDINLDMKGYHLPIFDVPEGFTPPTYLRHLCEKGLTWRYGEQRAATDEELRFRLDHELNIIGKMGFETYFLIVWDLGEFARRSLDWWIANGERFYPGQSYEEWKENDIWWNVRGSGAGSVVAYTLGITGIDPLANGLIFERFLNPGRVSMPDIDLDYPDDRRHEMVEYAMRKYGSDKVAQIITFGTLGARAAIRDVARAMDVPLSQVDEIAKMIPAIPGKPVTIANVLDKEHEFYNAEFEALYKTDEAIRNLIETAQNLEGVARHASSHAAGVIISDKPLVEYVPLNRPTSGEAGLGGIDRVTQWPMEVVESIGLLKVDFLGLSTLTVLRTAARLIEHRYGTKYQMDNIPYDVGHVGPDSTKAPEALFDMLGRGEVQGVFQVEGAGMRRLMMEMRPRRFDHIIAAISLYRPGPMEQIPTYIKRMHGIEEVQYHVPDLESILGDTYGICVSGDSLVMDARTGQRYRLDEVGKLADFVIQGVDEQWRPATGRVVRWIDSGHKPVYQITLHNGAQIKVTADHRLLTEAGWRPLCELGVGDYIGTPPHLLGPTPEDALPFDRQQLRVLAYLIADGSLASVAAADFVSKEAALLTEYQHCLEAFAGVKPSFTAQVRGVTRIGAAKENLNGNVHYHTPNSLLAWLRELGLKAAPGERPGGLRSHEKFIPPFVFGLDDEAIAFFLASLWDCDGYVGKRLCHYKTVSPQLSEGVQTLLLRLGIRSTVYQAEYMNGETHRIGYQVTVYDTGRLLSWLRPHLVSAKKDVPCAGKDDYTIGRDPFISEVDGATILSRRGLMAEYGIDRQHFYPRGRQRERISAQVVRPLTQMLSLPETARRLNTIWEEIVAIEPAGVAHVYDLTVEGLHSFVANNIIVHNCVYQEQIIQMASKLAGYEPGEADMIRKAVSKKKRDLIDKHRVMFTDGGVAKGYPREAMEAIWGDIEFFARYGFNKCLPGDVEVVDAATGRLVRIEDLYRGAAAIQHTLTCDTGQLKLQSGQVTAVLDNGIKPVYRLTTALGRQIEATANHPFYTFAGWRQLDELQLGSQIAVPRHLPVEGHNEWPEHEVIVLAHLLAEGNLCHPYSVYYYTQHDPSLQDYVQAVEQFDNVEAKVATHRNTYSVYARRRVREQEPGVVPWAKRLGIWGKNAQTKEFPADVFTLTNRQIALLLGRLWDGAINRQMRQNIHAYYATASERLARQMQHLLLRLGIVASLRQAVFPYKEGRIGYQVHVMGSEQMEQFARVVGPHLLRVDQLAMCQGLLNPQFDATATARDVIPMPIKELVRAEKEVAGLTWTQIHKATGVAQREFSPTNSASKRGFRRGTIERLADFFASDDLHRYARSDIYWDQVVNIEYVGEKQTYDLTIDQTHNFIANDILVHNSHAADYAVITCQTAFLKAHYPVEYMAALLSVDRDKSEKVAKYLAEARRLGIQVAPPDVNTANLDFTIEDTDKGAIIRYGMGAIKNAGESAINVLLEGRRTNGPFKDLDTFCDQVDLRRVGKRALESMIKVGVFDQWGTRPQLLDALDRMMGHSGKTHDAAAVGQMSLFGMLGGSTGNGVQADLLRPPTEVPAIDHRQLLDWEKELIGVYLSEHPLARALNELKHVVTVTTGELDETKNGREVTVAGLIAHLRPHTTKKGDAMAFGSLEDLEGKVDLLFFPRTWKEYRGKIKVEQVVVIRGKVQAEQDSVTILVDKVQDNFTVARSADEESYIPPADEFSPDWLADAPDDEPFADEMLVNGAGLVSRPQARNGNGNGHGPKNGHGKPAPARIAEPAPMRYTPPPPPNFEESEQWAVSSEQSAVTSGKELVGTQRNSEELSPQHSALSTQSSALSTDQSPVSSLSVSQSPQPRHVVIEIAAASNWRDIIRQVHHIASQHQGSDPFTLVIPEKGHRMTFPNLSTHYSPELLTALRQVPGVKNIVAE